MIDSKVSLLAVAFGAAATFGFVWLGRRQQRALAARPVPLPALEPDDAARADALRDLDAAEGDDSELDFFDVDVTEVEPNSEGVELRALEDEALASDEPYDAVDPENLGTEFLRRAMGADVPSGDSSSLRVFDGSADVAVELPVGRIESDGTTELPVPKHPAAAATDLSPNEDELEQRRATETESKGEHGGTGKIA